MKIKIERFPVHELWNNEFPQMALHVISIGQKYDMRRMNLNKSFDELNSFTAQLEAMRVSEGKNAKNALKEMNDRERDILINAFRKVVDAVEKVELPSIRPHYELLNALLTKHKASSIASTGNISETQRITMLENDINADSDIQNAIETLIPQDIVPRLFESNREYGTLFREIIADKSMEEKQDVSLLRKSFTKAMGQFFDAIQYCAFEHEDIDYMPLIREIEKLNAYYRQQLKARATRRKNGKKVNEEEPIIPPEE